jgi:hypothetical protein
MKRVIALVSVALLLVVTGIYAQVARPKLYSLVVQGVV